MRLFWGGQVHLAAQDSKRLDLCYLLIYDRASGWLYFQENLTEQCDCKARLPLDGKEVNGMVGVFPRKLVSGTGVLYRLGMWPGFGPYQTGGLVVLRSSGLTLSSSARNDPSLQYGDWGWPLSPAGCWAVLVRFVTLG